MGELSNFNDWPPVDGSTWRQRYCVTKGGKSDPAQEVRRMRVKVSQMSDGNLIHW